MLVPVRLVAGVAVVALLAGCPALGPDPEPTAAAPSLGVVPMESRTPEPSISGPMPSSARQPGTVVVHTPPGVVPRTMLTTGPTPGTVLGSGGRVGRYVDFDPSMSFKCRPLTEGERVQAGNSLSGGKFQAKRPARAVDLPEEGFAVVAFWGTDENGKARPWAVVTGGGRLSDLYDTWPGSHTLAGVAFADGPKALAAARTCVA